MKLSFSFALLTFSLFTMQDVLACTCLPGPPYIETVVNSKHIFVARIVSASLSPDGNWMEASFEVEEVGKGNPSAVPKLRARFEGKYDYEMSLGASIAHCGRISFSPGLRYLVFAASDGAVEITACGTSRHKKRRQDGAIDHIKQILANQPAPNE